MGKYTDVSFFERIGNAFSAANTRRKYIAQQRKMYNSWASHMRKTEKAELKKERDERVKAAEQKFAGDKESLADELNKIDSDINRRMDEVGRKYDTWNTDALFDANSGSGAKVYDAATGQYREMSNLERADTFKNHMESDTEEGRALREFFSQEGGSAEGDGSTAEGGSAEGDGSTAEGGNGRNDNIQRLNNNHAHDIANALYGQDPSGRSKQLRNQAEMHRKQAADEQKNSQQNFQIANRDARVEADKDAVATAASKNAQTVNNLSSGTGAGAAALNRTVETGDPNTHRQRADQQRMEGVKNQREMWGARQTAEEEDGSANITDYKYKQARGKTAISDYLSQAEDEPTGDTTQKPVEQKPPTQDTVEPKPVEQNPPVRDAVEQAPKDKVHWQNVINVLTGYEPVNGPAITENDRQHAQKIEAEFGVKIVPHGTYQGKYNADGAAGTKYWINDPDTGDVATKDKIITDLKANRSPTGDSNENFDVNDVGFKTKTDTVDVSKTAAEIHNSLR